MKYNFMYETPMQVTTIELTEPLKENYWKYGTALYYKIDNNNLITMEPDNEVPNDSHIEYDLEKAVCIIYSNTELALKLIGRNQEVIPIIVPTITFRAETKTQKEKEMEIGMGML